MHRYLGIALGLVMSIWCLSGIVMMYVQYPEFSPEDEVRSLAPLDVSACCRLPPDVQELAGVALTGMRIEMMGGSPVLRLVPVRGREIHIDLAAGRVIDGVNGPQAQMIAQSYAKQTGIEAFHPLGLQERDQWTVYGAYNVHRPLYKFAGDDPARTQWYVSSRSGEVVQATILSQRVWNWLGAVPHWLYPTLLRQHTALWSQIVIWLTIFGTFLTVLGIYVGIKQYKTRRSGRYSPYRGAAFWHHYAGLLFGILTLTWLVSGFFSMNPWGALESRSFSPEAERLRGAELTFGAELQALVLGLRDRSIPNGAVRLEGGVLQGERYFVSWDAAGNRQRLGADLRGPEPLVASRLERAGALLRPNVGVVGGSQLDRDDAYYYSHHERRRFPVYRVEYGDGERLYLDAVSGEISYAVDTNLRLYRWLHFGLHRGDFTATLRARPVWDGFMLMLMIGVTVGALTGTWLGIRRVVRRRGRAQLPEVTEVGAEVAS